MEQRQKVALRISSLLGVAGGEFIIPILIFIFGVDIRTAGTESVLISLPVVLTGDTSPCGRDFREQPLVYRRARLEALLKRAKCNLIRFSEALPDAGAALSRA